MKNFSTYDIVLVKYPFSDLSTAKVRPAVVVNLDHPSIDLMIVPLTSQTDKLMPGEFILTNWEEAGLNVQTAAKRGIYTISSRLFIKTVGQLNKNDIEELKKSLRTWMI